MHSKRSSLKSTSADFEKAAMERFRSLAIYVPENCQVFREPWDCSTVLCLNFEACPDLLESVKHKVDVLASAAHALGLARSIIFKIGNKVQGWSQVTL